MFPIWMYFVVAGIFISAFMAVKASREERQEEMKFIEKEGEVFIKRMEEEKQKKEDVNRDPQGA
ncbi:hypothetical protein J2S13_001147 [Oikeobacillus pervagus]|uniref:SigE-dependent sporulation protein n=1 Tax=Oikeobacillus pervagus TaxID=1325931 RepID=A0AAJ1SXU8_9BACI|nr:sporulation YhaL family protein [Oikeobacillus pervagus]MDQ0214750.1 hypothetical protein [Oikeobacillus pervagus]